MVAGLFLPEHGAGAGMSRSGLLPVALPLNPGKSARCFHWVLLTPGKREEAEGPLRGCGFNRSTQHTSIFEQKKECCIERIRNMSEDQGAPWGSSIELSERQDRDGLISSL